MTPAPVSQLPALMPASSHGVTYLAIRTASYGTLPPAPAPRPFRRRILRSIPGIPGIPASCAGNKKEYYPVTGLVSELLTYSNETM